METLDDLGITQETLDSLSQETRDDLVRGQARLLADRQMMATDVLRQDDEQLRARTAKVQNHILGQTEETCADEPVESEKADEMRIHSLGDVYIGDEALVNQRIKQQTGIQLPPQPPPQPPEQKRSLWPYVLGTIATGVLAGGLTAYLMDDTDTQNTIRPSNPDQILDFGATK